MEGYLSKKSICLIVDFFVGLSPNLFVAQHASHYVAYLHILKFVGRDGTMEVR